MPLLPSIASPMHGAMVPIAYATPSNATVTFTNIPQGYQDLFIVMYARSSGNSSSGTVEGRFNGDTSSNYSFTYLNGNGSGAASGRGSSATIFAAGRATGTSVSSSIFSTSTLYILNYANTTTYKTCLERGADDENGSGVTEMWVSLWRSTSAITSISLATPGQTNFASGTTIALYGVRTVNQ